MTPEVPIIACTESAIKQGSKDWICQSKGKENNKTVLVSAMIDATKVPALGKFSQRYHAWVGGTYPNHYISEENFDQDRKYYKFNNIF